MPIFFHDKRHDFCREVSMEDARMCVILTYRCSYSRRTQTFRVVLQLCGGVTLWIRSPPALVQTREETTLPHSATLSARHTSACANHWYQRSFPHDSKLSAKDFTSVVKVHLAGVKQILTSWRQHLRGSSCGSSSCDRARTHTDSLTPPRPTRRCERAAVANLAKKPA